MSDTIAQVIIAAYAQGKAEVISTIPCIYLVGAVMGFVGGYFAGRSRR